MRTVVPLFLIFDRPLVLKGQKEYEEGNKIKERKIYYSKRAKKGWESRTRTGINSMKTANNTTDRV